MKKIIFFLFLFIFCNTSFAFSFRKTIKDNINLKYKNEYVDSNFIIDNYFIKNGYYFICGKLNFILLEKNKEVSNKKCTSSENYCSILDFTINIGNKDYNLNIDSLASIMKPWQNFNEDSINVIHNCKVCFNVEEKNINIKNLNKYDIGIKFE